MVSTLAYQHELDASTAQDSAIASSNGLEDLIVRTLEE